MDVSINGELLATLSELKKEMESAEANILEADSAMARLRQLKEQRVAYQETLREKRAAWDAAIKQVPNELRPFLEGGLVRAAVNKEIATRSKRKSTPRWRLKAILTIIKDNEGLSKSALIKKLQEEKPGAPLDKLDDYLKKYTTGPKLKLNKEGLAIT